MIVSILGGGHIGTTMAGYLSKFGNVDEVRLYTSKPDEFINNLIVNDIEQNLRYEASIDLISNKIEDVVTNSDIIFVTFPHFMIEETLIKILPFIKKGVYVGIIPGSGGCEFFWKKYYNNDYTLFGFQRVPFTAKYAVYGKETNLKSWKPCVVVASIPISRNNEVCDIIEKTCNFKCEQASNFLAVTLTPSNPVLHTSRTYDLYYQSSPDTIFKEKGYFYKEWTDHASETLFGIDGELQELLKKIDKIDLSSVKPLGVHYEAPTIELMTKKITSIPTFQSVPTARISVNGGYIADINSRYFTEDFPWGLCIIKGFAEIAQIKTPTIDKVLKWYEKYMNLEYYVDNKFCGKDLEKTGIPQNYGILTMEDLYDFYL